ncbi:MAG: RNA methyltransferase [Ruminococcaceae bacterium]|nr:RNA methyltransferase [Oscillospiraceae bacterium]
MVTQITSKDNVKIKLAVALKSRQKREEYGLFCFEGDKLSIEALNNNADIQFIFISSSYKDQSLAEIFDKNKIDVYIIPPNLFDKITQSQTPQGVLTVAKIKSLKTVDNIKEGRYIALDAMSDPGNLGAVLRSVDAFSIDGIILGAGCTDLFSAKTIRGSMGSFFRCNYYLAENLSYALDALRCKGFDIYCADLDSHAVSLNNLTFSKNVVITIGNESNGISDKVKEVSKTLYIPMSGKSESLNASVAAGIICWELSKS